VKDGTVDPPRPDPQQDGTGQGENVGGGGGLVCGGGGGGLVVCTGGGGAGLVVCVSDGEGDGFFVGFGFFEAFGDGDSDGDGEGLGDGERDGTALGLATSWIWSCPEGTFGSDSTWTPMATSSRATPPIFSRPSS
jgi:hypothetical protein